MRVATVDALLRTAGCDHDTSFLYDGCVTDFDELDRERFDKTDLVSVIRPNCFDQCIALLCVRFAMNYSLLALC
jgi:hypothetical protein